MSTGHNVLGYPQWNANICREIQQNRSLLINDNFGTFHFVSLYLKHYKKDLIFGKFGFSRRKNRFFELRLLPFSVKPELLQDFSGFSRFPSITIGSFWVGTTRSIHFFCAKFPMETAIIQKSYRLYKHPSIALYYISLLSGLGNIDYQNRNPNINNRDHLLGRPTSVGFWDGKDPSKQIQGL